MPERPTTPISSALVSDALKQIIPTSQTPVYTQTLASVIDGYLIGLALIGTVILIIGRFSPQSVGVVGTGLGLMLLTKDLIQRGRSALASLVFVTGWWALGVVFVPLTGDMTTTAAAVFIPIMVMAMLFLERRLGVIFTLMTLAYLLVLLLLHNSGTALPQLFTLQGVSAWLMIALNFVMVLLPVSIVQQGLRDALKTSQEQIAVFEQLEQVLTRDIEQRKQTEAALRESEERYRAISELISDYAFAYEVLPDKTFVPIWVTDASYTRITGYAIGDISGSMLYHPDDVDRVKQDVAQTLDGNDAHGEYRIITKNKQERWISIHRKSFYDPHEQRVVRLYGAAQDITERKLAEAALKASEQELQRYADKLEQMVEDRTAQLRRTKEQIELILDNTSDALALTQPNGDIQTMNPAFKITFSDRVTRAIEQILGVIGSPEQINTVGNALLNVIYDRVNQRVEARIETPNGQSKDIDLALIAVNPSGGGGMNPEGRNGVLVSARDITHLKEIERFKERFVANAVHDLATPITGLSSRLYLLKRSPDNLDQHVRALENQVEHLRNLLEDLRTLSQLDRGQIKLNPEPCDLNAMMQRVFDTYEPVAFSQRQTLLLGLTPHLPLVRLDKRQFERALVNLVANAIDYTPEGKRILFQNHITGQTVRIRVHDQGIGIASEDLPHIFERFYRTNRARSSKSSGTGLGLAIVKEIVELHGGEVQVESQEDVGSTFTITLPV